MGYRQGDNVPQLNSSLGGGSKQRLAMSIDANLNGQGKLSQTANQAQINQLGGHAKHISMNGLPFDRTKGLTPIPNKGPGSLGKSGNIQLQGQAMSNIHNEERDPSAGRTLRQNSRNGHNRMPSLPASIKGGIGNHNPGQMPQINQGNDNSKRLG